jgi:hypothetical protein
MKKIGLILALAAIACGGIFAQAAPAPAAAATVVQVSGSLSLVNGHIALKDGGKTYYLEGIQRMVGFVDGLKEGASIKAEGYALPMNLAPDYAFLRLTKVTFNGKSYDIAQPARPDKAAKQGAKHGRW